MRALSVKQPWVEEIFSGRKRIDYRTWETSYRGDLLIYASTTKDVNVLNNLQSYGHKASDLVFGAFVGVVRVTDCKYNSGEYDWYYSDIRRFIRPVPYDYEDVTANSKQMFEVANEVVWAALQELQKKARNEKVTVSTFAKKFKNKPDYLELE